MSDVSLYRFGSSNHGIIIDYRASQPDEILDKYYYNSEETLWH